MFKSSSLIIILITFWLIISNSFCEEFIPSSNIALLVAVVDDSDSSDNRYQHLIKYQFLNGELVQTDTILSNPGGQLRFNQKNHIYENRYIITGFADIVDIVTHQFIHKGGFGKNYTKYLGIEDKRVIIYTPKTDKYHYYDLIKNVYRESEKPGKWSLPGLISPDGTKSVTSSWEKGRIDLHLIDGKKKQLAEGYYVNYSNLSSSLVGVPLLWLDNKRILTQRTNGEIVVIKTDRTVEHIVSIDVNQYDQAYPNFPGALGVRLYRNFDSKIIYSISLIGPDHKFHNNHLEINIEKKSFSIYNPEWKPLGHNFEYSLEDDISIIRYKEQVIGQEKNLIANNVKTTNDYIAFLSRSEPKSYPNSIKVWNNFNKQWTIIEYKSPIWFSHSTFFGWVVE